MMYLLKLLLRRSSRINGDKSIRSLEYCLAAVYNEEGGAYASAIGQESQDKLENAELQKQVKLLGNDNLDLDFLDERARLVLGLVGRDETIVFKTDPRLN